MFIVSISMSSFTLSMNNCILLVSFLIIVLLLSLFLVLFNIVELLLVILLIYISAIFLSFIYCILFIMPLSSNFSSYHYEFIIFIFIFVIYLSYFSYMLGATCSLSSHTLSRNILGVLSLQSCHNNISSKSYNSPNVVAGSYL